MLKDISEWYVMQGHKEGDETMRFGLRWLFVVVTAAGVLMAAFCRWYATDEYHWSAGAAVLYLPTGQADEMAEDWLSNRRFTSARLPVDIRDNWFICGNGRMDSDDVRCLSTFCNDSVPGLPIYASLCLAPVDDDHAIVRLEFEARFRISKFNAARLAAGRASIQQLGKEADEWLAEQARISGAPPPGLALRLARLKPGSVWGTQFELAGPLALHKAQQNGSLTADY